MAPHNVEWVLVKKSADPDALVRRVAEASYSMTTSAGAETTVYPTKAVPQFLVCSITHPSF
jgi:hypothetical protein